MEEICCEESVLTLNAEIGRRKKQECSLMMTNDATSMLMELTLHDHNLVIFSSRPNCRILSKLPNFLQQPTLCIYALSFLTFFFLPTNLQY